MEWRNSVYSLIGKNYLYIAIKGIQQLDHLNYSFYKKLGQGLSALTILFLLN